MTTDLTDLFASDDPKPEKPRKKMGRPTREEALAKAQALEEPLPHYSVFRQPVGVTYLAKVVGRQPRQIEKRLEKCPVHTWTGHQGKQVPMYDFLTAMAYLIPPRGTLKTGSPSRMLPHCRPTSTRCGGTPRTSGTA